MRLAGPDWGIRRKQKCSDGHVGKTESNFNHGKTEVAFTVILSDVTDLWQREVSVDD